MCKKYKIFSQVKELELAQIHEEIEDSALYHNQGTLPRLWFLAKFMFGV